MYGAAESCANKTRLSGEWTRTCAVYDRFSIAFCLILVMVVPITTLDALLF